MKALLAFLAMTVAANAECQKPDDIRKSVQLAMPTAIVNDLGQLGTQMFITAFNAYPPQSQHVADQILVADKPNAPRVAVIYFIKGCYVASSFPERKIYDDIMGHKL